MIPFGINFNMVTADANPWDFSNPDYRRANVDTDIMVMDLYLNQARANEYAALRQKEQMINNYFGQMFGCMLGGGNAVGNYPAQQIGISNDDETATDENREKLQNQKKFIDLYCSDENTYLSKPDKKALQKEMKEILKDKDLDCEQKIEKLATLIGNLKSVNSFLSDKADKSYFADSEAGDIIADKLESSLDDLKRNSTEGMLKGVKDISASITSDNVLGVLSSWNNDNSDIIKTICSKINTKFITSYGTGAGNVLSEESKTAINKIQKEIVNDICNPLLDKAKEYKSVEGMSDAVSELKSAIAEYRKDNANENIQNILSDKVFNLYKALRLAEAKAYDDDMNSNYSDVVTAEVTGCVNSAEEDLAEEEATRTGKKIELDESSTTDKEGNLHTSKDNKVDDKNNKYVEVTNPQGEVEYIYLKNANNKGLRGGHRAKKRMGAEETDEKGIYSINGKKYTCEKREVDGRKGVTVFVPVKKK